MTRILLDVDTGTDDAVAIMAAALHPELEIVGITCVNGNVSLDHVVDNTLRVIDHIGAAVPVYRGASRPLIRPDFPIPRRILNPEGSEFQVDELPLPAAVSTTADASAVDAIVSTFLAPGAEDVVLVATGPLTNVAAALAAEPRLAERIGRLVLMGGARGWGNVTGAAEFNIWVDPEAAEAVFSAGLRDVLVVPLDATHDAPLSLEDCQRFTELGTPAGIAAAELIRHRIIHYPDDPAAERLTAPVHDALCIAALVHPDVLQEVVSGTVHVETAGTHTLGELVLDTRPWRTERSNAHVALRADEHVFADFLADALRG